MRVRRLLAHTNAISSSYSTRVVVVVVQRKV